MKRWRRNWGGNIRWQAELAHPDDLDQLRQVLAEHEQITVLGSGHSFSGILAPNPDGVSLRPRDLPVSVRRGTWDEEVQAVRVQIAGPIAVGEAYERMDGLGLALPNSGSNEAPSVIGAAATAVHGSDPRFGSLSDARSLRAVHGLNGRGKPFDLDASRADDAEDLGALRAHLGGCGFVRGLQLAAIPTYNIASIDQVGSLGEALAEAEHVRARAARPDQPAERFEAFWFPGLWPSAPEECEADPLDCYASMTWKETTPRRPDPRWLAARGFVRDVVQGNWAIEGLLSAARTARLAGDGDGDLLRRLWWGLLEVSERREGGTGLVEPWWLALTGPRRFTGVSLEYALPIDALRDALLALHDRVVHWRLTEQYVLDLPINLRWTAGDRGVFMSPAHRGPTAWVDLTCSQYSDPDQYGPFLRQAEAILVEHGGLPHLGKAHWINPKRRWDPELWERFWAVRDRYDPDERFVNGHLAALRDGRDLDPGLP